MAFSLLFSKVKESSEYLGDRVETIATGIVSRCDRVNLTVVVGNCGSTEWTGRSIVSPGSSSYDYLAPQQARAVPGVLIAHGYAGSKQLMLGYGHVLAQAGYAVMVVALIDEAWISAIASALFFGWVLAAGFPLSNG